MTKYNCGHETDGIMIIADDIFSYIHYEEWSKEKCPKCWMKETGNNIKHSMQYKDVEGKMP